MPELPEVETVRRGLTPAMEGRRILRAEARRPDLRFPFPERFAERLTGTLVERLDRRSKYLLARLGSGETLLMHLGMSGRFSVTADDLSRQPGDFVYAAPANPTHDHVVFHIEGGVTVTYNDPRRFGFMTLYEPDQEDIQPYLKDLGPEPLSNGFSEDRLNEAFKTRRSPVKAGLLDQSVVAGLGNIYVCEALWRGRRSAPGGYATPYPAPGPPVWRRRCATSSPKRSRRAAPPCATMPGRTAPWGISSTGLTSMGAKANPAIAVRTAVSSASFSRAGRAFSVRPASASQTCSQHELLLTIPVWVEPRPRAFIPLRHDLN